jgi:hypothetical protein
MSRLGLSWNRAIAIVFVLGVLGVVLTAKGEADAYSDAVAIVRGFGYFAFSALSAALCISPLRAWIYESA